MSTMLLRSELASRFLRLSSHPKWEVRKAVSHAVLFLRHDAFPAVIARIIEDENTWVREAARKTLQRRDGLGRGRQPYRQPRRAILGILSALEARYGLRARRAALNVADHLNHRFVREAYHEIVRIISPLDASLLNLEKELQGIPSVPDHTFSHARPAAQERVQLITEFLDNLRAFTTTRRPSSPWRRWPYREGGGGARARPHRGAHRRHGRASGGGRLVEPASEPVAPAAGPHQHHRQCRRGLRRPSRAAAC